MITLNEFKNYLVQKGYREFSANGSRSTVYDYEFRIKKICEFEKLTLKDLSDKVNVILPDYKANGIKWNLGQMSHESVLNALRQFKQFSSIQQA